VRHEDLYGPDMVLGQWLRTKHTAIKINDILFNHAGLTPSFVDSNYTVPALNDAVRRHMDVSSVDYRFNDEAMLMYGSLGPLWYRGFWEAREGRYPQTTDADIDRLLEFYDATSIVVGHSNMDSVLSYYDGKVYAIDVLFEDLNSLQGLLWQDGSLYRVTGTGARDKLK
jgi:hypothetical protein